MARLFFSHSPITKTEVSLFLPFLLSVIVNESQQGQQIEWRRKVRTLSPESMRSEFLFFSDDRLGLQRAVIGFLLSIALWKEE